MITTPELRAASPAPPPFDLAAIHISATGVGPDPEQTAHLLERWHGGDRAALDELLLRNLAWVQDYVGRRLGPQLLQKEEAVDLVQDACVDILTYGPRFVVADRARFRALLGRMVENNLRDKRDYYAAQRRDADRERGLSSCTVLRLGETPSQIVARDEHAEMTRLAIDLLPPQERDVLVLREYEQLQYDDIAAKVGLSTSGVRKCYRRALVALAGKVRSLRKGLIDDAIGDLG